MGPSLRKSVGSPECRLNFATVWRLLHMWQYDLIAWILHEYLIALLSLTGQMNEREWKQQADVS